MAKVLVETISIFRHRYVVETPDNHPEYALDTVVTQSAKEVSQLHLDETIVSHRVISEEDYLQLFDTDNDYLSSLTNEQKLKFITQI